MKRNNNVLKWPIVFMIILGLIGFAFTISGRAYISAVSNCSTVSNVDKPAFYPANHPVIEVTQEAVAKNQWVVIKSKNWSATIMYSDSATVGDQTRLDGSVADLTGKGTFVLQPGIYTFDVYIQPRLEDKPYPELLNTNKVQTFDLSVEDCSK